MKVTFLEAKVPLTKTFSIENGELKKVGHPRILDYLSHEAEHEGLDDLAVLLKEHAAKNHCLLKGNLLRTLHWESRRGTTDPNAPTRILCLDLDGLKGVQAPQDFMDAIGLGDVDYVVQYSASSGVVPDRGLSCHIFCLLDKPHAPATLKQHLMSWNLSIPTLRQDLGLARTNSALRWPLDVSTCQNDKLIYIAPPILGAGVKDGFKGERIRLVRRKRRVVTLPALPSAELNRSEAEKALNTLRRAMGLAERPRTQYKTAGAVEYLARPDKATLTGIRRERGFVYMNLNGGDSWAYYHPESNPEFIYNFKGEPAYKTAELLPEYWAEVKAKVNEPQADSGGNLYVVCRDFKTASYYNAIYNERTGDLQVAQARNEGQLKNFRKQYGLPAGDFIPDYDVFYDPSERTVVDTKARRMNLYRPSEFERRLAQTPEAEAREIGKQMPQAVRDVMAHVLADDGEILGHMTNWLACVQQFKDTTQTAWVWHGIQGTGKGLMLNYIVRPLLGPRNVASKRMQELEEQFNGFLANCLFLFVDEAQLSAYKRGAVMEANLKNYMVEPIISIRPMYSPPFDVKNRLNIVFASNKDDPVAIDPHDRRFNVAKFQPERLEITTAGVQALQEAAWPMYCYLQFYPADRDKARTPLNTAAKEQLVHVSRASIDVVSDALLDGNLQFLKDLLPTMPINSLMYSMQQAADQYKDLVAKIEKGELGNCLTRDELFVILNYVIGGMPPAPAKFTALLKHHRLHLQSVRRGDQVLRGVPTRWKKC